MSILARQQSRLVLGAVAAPVRSTLRSRAIASTNSNSARFYTATTSLRAENENASNDKNTKAPQPKILNVSPPKEEDASEEVKAHNREVDRRADQPQAKVNDKDVEKDKVSKGFWNGQ